MVFANGNNAQMGRYPNSGWLTYQSQSVSGNNLTQGAENVTITSNNVVGNWTGAEIFIYANRYAFDQSFITSQSGGTITYASVNKPVYEQKTPKFIIQNDPRTLIFKMNGTITRRLTNCKFIALAPLRTSKFQI